MCVAMVRRKLETVRLSTVCHRVTSKLNVKGLILAPTRRKVYEVSVDIKEEPSSLLNLYYSSTFRLFERFGVRQTERR